MGFCSAQVFSVTLAHYDCGMKGEIIIKEQQSTTADSIHVCLPRHPLHESSVRRQHMHLQQELAVVIERFI